MYELKDMLKQELHEASKKGNLTPQDAEMVKKLSESLYYITAVCAMEDGNDDYSGRRMPMYSMDGYSNDYYGASRRRNSLGQFSRDGYSQHDLNSKRAYLEEMMNEARSESERDLFRKKLDELNRQMM